MYSIDRIQSMEQRLNLVRENFDALEACLERFREILPEYDALSNYYGSESYHEDVDAMEEGKLPADLPCGVLTEDLVYNLFTDQRRLLTQLLKTSADFSEI